MQIIPLDRDVPEVWTLGPAVGALQRGELVIIPTDTIYAIACNPWDRQAVSKLYAAKQMDKAKRCSVICGDLKEVGSVARAVSDAAFRFMRQNLPGAYTILLHASRELPKQATGKRKTIGIRMPDHMVCQALAEELGQPILVTSVPPIEDEPLIDPVEVARRLYVRPAYILDQGPQAPEPSTVIDFTVDPPELVREGKGDVWIDEDDLGEEAGAWS